MDKKRTEQNIKVDCTTTVLRTEVATKMQESNSSTRKDSTLTLTNLREMPQVSLVQGALESKLPELVEPWVLGGAKGRLQLRIVGAKVQEPW